MTMTYTICDICEEPVGLESHYHCGNCHDPKPTSMMGHYTNHVGYGNDGKIISLDEWGFACDPEFKAKINAARVEAGLDVLD